MNLWGLLIVAVGILIIVVVAKNGASGASGLISAVKGGS
jgi:hypothetical protein